MRKQENIISGIYCIENKINNKKYIGQSKDIYDRWSKHKSELNHGYHHNTYLQKSWNKYGEDSFKFYILEQCAQNKLDEKEIYYINMYDSLNSDNGYNLKEGGQDGVVNKESNEKKRQSLIEAYKNPELKKKRSDDATKQWSDPKIKAKITGVNNGMYGNHHSDETRKLLSEMKKGKPVKKNTTPVLCVELNQVFDCALEASKKLNLNSSRILRACRENRITGGYHWQFVEENNIS